MKHIQPATKVKAPKADSHSNGGFPDSIDEFVCGLFPDKDKCEPQKEL